MRLQHCSKGIKKILQAGSKGTARMLGSAMVSWTAVAATHCDWADYPAGSAEGSLQG